MVSEPTPYIISLERNYVNKPIFMIFMENVPVTVTLNKYDIRKSKAKGPVSNHDFEIYQAKLAAFNEKFIFLSARRREVAKDGSKEIRDSIDAASRLISAQQKDTVKAFIKKHPSSIVSAWAMTRFLIFDPEDALAMRTLYNKLSPALYKTSYGKQIKERLAIGRMLAVGQPAPGFTQNDTSGNPISLKDFKGKYVLVDFWASWCGPCRAENPNVVAAYNKYNGKNFTILSVSLDRPGAKDAWLTAIHKDSLVWTHVSDLKFWDNAVSKLYGVNSVPANFLIDPAGKIVAKDLHDEKLQSTLEDILK
jgi:peroxiredoxin